jgi:hypothetical protein
MLRPNISVSAVAIMIHAVSVVAASSPAALRLSRGLLSYITL